MDQKTTPPCIMSDREIRKSVAVIMLTLDEKDKGCAMRHLLERESGLNQKQTTYGSGRERPFFSTPSFDWSWHYVAKCPDE